MAHTPVLVKNLLAVLNEIAAFSLAETWDNVGLMVGSPDQEISGILVALDPTEDLLDEARTLGANTIVTHHPTIFHPLKAIYTDRPAGRFLSKALARDMAIIGCHTNLDIAAGGVNDVLAARLGLVETRPLADCQAGNDSPQGFGRMGRFPAPLDRESFLTRLFSLLDTSVVRVAGIMPETLTAVAVCGGSGSDLAETALHMGAQVYITGEVKHSTARWAEASRFCIVDGGHFATENVIVPPLAEDLQKRLSRTGARFSVQASARQRGPFGHLVRSDEAVTVYSN